MTDGPMKDLADALRRTAVSTREALDAIVNAATSLSEGVTAAELVRDERGDLRETVHRLEDLIVDQGEQLKALRAKLDANGHQ
jgi:hypothetical protein